jgi:hypothetical protein
VIAAETKRRHLHARGPEETLRNGHRASVRWPDAPN